MGRGARPGNYLGNRSPRRRPGIGADRSGSGPGASPGVAAFARSGPVAGASRGRGFARELARKKPPIGDGLPMVNLDEDNITPAVVLYVLLVLLTLFSAVRIYLLPQQNQDGSTTLAGFVRLRNSQHANQYEHLVDHPPLADAAPDQ